MEGTTAATQTNLEALQTLGISSVYLMGFSFIIGSLFTILVLILLDFVRRNKEPAAK